VAGSGGNGCGWQQQELIAAAMVCSWLSRGKQRERPRE